MKYGRLVQFLMLAVVFACSIHAQKPGKDEQPEQTSFGSDWLPGKEFIRRPVEVPAAALQVLRDTLHRGTVNCLKNKGVTPDEVPASWFVASEIHLDGPEEVDLIVEPNAPKIITPEFPPAASCLFGANVDPFWVLRNTSGRYSLLLETYAHGLEVLDSRTNWYRDLQTVSYTAVVRTTLLYKMAVAQYQLAEKKTEP